MFVQFVRARQLKAQSVQRSLEEVAVRQIEIEKESVEIGKLILPQTSPQLKFPPNLPPFYPNLTPFYPDLILIPLLLNPFSPQLNSL